MTIVSDRLLVFIGACCRWLAFLGMDLFKLTLSNIVPAPMLHLIQSDSDAEGIFFTRGVKDNKSSAISNAELANVDRSHRN